MAKIKELRCVTCGRSYQENEITYTCETCGEVGTLDILYDYDALRSTLDRDSIRRSTVQSAWRYKELLPVQPESAVPPLQVGWTPLYSADRLHDLLDVGDIWVKEDGANPTGSLKDRASSLVVARAMESNLRVVSTASTGNAAAALAGICASVDEVDAVIFVPASAPEAKIAQLLVYGAKVILVEDSYDVAFDLCAQVCDVKGWYCRNTGVNPFTTEGKKTVALEIAEQSNWQVPDVVVVSVGDGSIISGIYKGFSDLLQLGWIERIPRLIGVQAVGSSPLAQAWQNRLDAKEMNPVEAHTIADSISSGYPRDRAKALRAVRNTDGAYVTVNDEAIIQAIPQLAQRTGVFAEPASATALAGAITARQQGYIQAHESVCLVLTGNGLKDIKTARKSVAEGVRVQPDLSAVLQAIDQIL